MLKRSTSNQWFIVFIYVFPSFWTWLLKLYFHLFRYNTGPISLPPQFHSPSRHSIGKSKYLLNISLLDGAHLEWILHHFYDTIFACSELLNNITIKISSIIIFLTITDNWRAYRYSKMKRHLSTNSCIIPKVFFFSL